MSTKRVTRRHSDRTRGGHGRARRQRLSPDARQRDLLRAAARLMTEHGVDAVQIPAVAAAAGVTRQLVYRFFPSRQALIMAVLEDFAEDLTQRLGRAAVYRLPGNLEEGTRVFIDVICDTIEAKGAGPWDVLGSNGPDRVVSRLGRQIQDRILEPWRARIAETIGASERDAAIVAQMIIAGGRAALQQWFSGVLSREEAARATTRGVNALLQAFTSAGRQPRRDARNH